MTKLVLKSLSTIAVASILFTGCANTAPATPEEKADFRCRQDGTLAPEWTCNPFIEGGIAALGIAKQNAGHDKSMQRSTALADGRDALASQISTKVSNLFKSYKGTTGSGDAATFDATTSKVSKQLASQTLNGSKSVKSWTNPANSDLYLLVTISNEPIKIAMNSTIKTSFKNNQAMYQKFLASKADGDLDKELEKAAK
jgi:hypothetical protein